MENCIFCKIAKGEIPSNKVYEDEMVLVFKDLNPQAPTHLLAIPKRHISHIDELEESDKELIGHIYYVISELSKELNLKKGFRVVANCREDGGQTVDHIHFHILAGRSLNWPPG